MGVPFADEVVGIDFVGQGMVQQYGLGVLEYRVVFNPFEYVIRQTRSGSYVQGL